MIPALGHDHQLSPAYQAYAEALRAAGFAGDIDSSYASRLTMATDNSVYQKLPQLVIFPRHSADVQLAVGLANRAEHRSVRFTPRGGGTGTNGQALNDGIVVDLSRYMNRVLSVDGERRRARVEAGLVKDALNEQLTAHGLFFSPELSTSNRATIGGMVSTDASGQGSLAYGKTSDHVLGLTLVLMDGSLLQTGPVAKAEAEKLALEEGMRGAIYRQVLDSCVGQRSLIEAKFPPLNRFLTGYDLKHAYDPATDTIDIGRLICGAEGTLALVTEVEIDLTPIPNHRTLVNIQYASFDAALRHAPAMVAANALSVETVDSRVLGLAKEDIVWHSVKSLLGEGADKALGLNIVEFADDDAATQSAKVEALTRVLDEELAAGRNGVLGYQLCADLPSINKVYGMRKKAVGLLGNAKGSRKPIAFTEDTCVPPHHLADYIAEFRALLDGHNLQYGMFGHVDAGVLHVRPALDMCDPADEQLLRTISDQVVALTAKYGGLMWGEHGKGFRSEYGPAFFGDELFAELRRIKGVFDPDNRLNPGKICTPLASSEALVSVDDLKRGAIDRAIPVEVRDSFAKPLACNGNGLCFNYEYSSPMCPSMRVSQDRRHSPKGRAMLVREWLRLLAASGSDVLALEQEALSRRTSLRDWVERWRNSRAAKAGQYDFSHEVMESMKGCLACKACSSQCPIKVDVPNFRARFMNLYYQRYLRAPRDYLVANIERALPLMAKAPGLINFFLKQRWVQKLTAATTGFVDAPLLSQPTLAAQLRGQSAIGYDLAALKALPAAERARFVLVVQDPFTSYYDADVVADFVRLIEALGFQPVLLPFKPNGKPEHVKGFLKAFNATARTSGQFLAELAALGMPLVGLDPALVLCYRDEYREVEGSRADEFEVMLSHEWLLSQLGQIPPAGPRATTPLRLLGHCTEKTALPASMDEWKKIFAHFGVPLESAPVGCCGMAGTYGHEAPNQQASSGIYQLSWAQAIDGREPESLLATGYSCRSQVKRYEGFKPKHPVQALLQLVGQGA